MGMAPREYPALTAEQTELAKSLRATRGYKNKPMAWRTIALKMGIGEYQLFAALCPERVAIERERKRKKHSNREKVISRPKNVIPIDRIAIPEFVLRERNQAMGEELSVGAVVFGDPPLSRSALGKRNGNSGTEAQGRQTREEWPHFTGTRKSKRGCAADAASNWQRFLARRAKTDPGR